MFPIPNVPTDSLYKFIFITGAILVTFSLYLKNGEEKDYNRFQFSRDSMHIATKHYLYLDSAKMAVLKTDMGDLNRNIDLFTKLQLELRTFKDRDASRQAYITKSLEGLRSESKTLMEKLVSSRDESSNYSRDREILLASLDNKIEKQKENVEKINTYLCYGIIAFGLGIFLWFFIVQLPQDKMYRIQLKLANIQLTKVQNSLSVLTRQPDQQTNNNDNP